MLRQTMVARPVAWAVTLAMTVVVSASCFASGDKTPEQKACCAAMGHDCGALAIEMDCCPGGTASIDAVAPAMALTLTAPTVSIVVAVLDQPPLDSRVHRALHGGRDLPLKPPGIPTYLLDSSFRI